MAAESPLPGSTEELVSGVLEALTYASGETHFLVGKLLPDGERERITVVGRLPGPVIGQQIRLWGRWVLNPKYGRQFKFERYHVSPPSTLDGLKRYLSSGVVEGIRERMVERIVSQFGDATFEILEKAPDRLREVQGLGKKRATALAKAWASGREQREVLVFLASQGIGGALAGRIHHRYGPETAHVVSTDPFRLVRDVDGIGFRTADAIAQRMGMPLDSPARAEAAVLHLLEEAARQGHLYEPAAGIAAEASQRLGIPPERVGSAVDALLAQSRLVGEGAEDSRDLYLPLYHGAERAVAERLLALGGEPSEIRLEDVEAEADAFEAEESLALDPLQREGLRRLAGGRVLVITGGPGTGKTTLLKSILRLFKKRGLVTVLAAPTGRAAKRMEEAAGQQAMTLHRLLKFDPKQQKFLHKDGLPLEAKAVIVDEVSMLDILLADALLQALARDSYLVLMGDVDQLPSVGAGSVLRDIIASQSIPTVTLRHVFRQAGESAIQHNAHRINQGEMPVFQKERAGAGQDFFLLQREDPADAARTVVDLYCHQIPRAYGYDPLRDIQVLTPMHKGDAGTTNLNRLIQGELGRPATGQLSQGDRVMQTVNNYQKEVFNGDAGVVLAYDSAQDLLQVDFDGRLIEYTTIERQQLLLAYAISVHKSQGSEYPAVIIPLTAQHFMLLQRNLLYTAVTRARKLVVLVGSMRALALAVNNNRIQHRNSRLAQLLCR